MNKPQKSGVERLPCKAELPQQSLMTIPWPTINRVADDRMSDGGHMDANLVGPSGFQTAFDQGRAAESFQQAPMSDRALAPPLLDDRDFLAVGRRASERGVDGSAPAFGQARDDRAVTAINAVLGELRGKTLMGRVGFGNHQQPGRILVDAVDNTGPCNAANPRQPPGAVVEEGVDECSVKIASGWMDNKARWLIDNEQMVILKDNVERNILRDIVRGAGRGNGEGVSGTRPGFGRRIPDKPALRGHLAAGDQRLDPLPRQGWHEHCQGAVQPPVRHVRRNSDAKDGRCIGHGLSHAAMALRISSKLHDELLALAAAAPGQEICGLLLGSVDRVDSLEPTDNVADDPTVFFEIDPARLIAAHRRARAGGPAILGFYHSHPNGLTGPSSKDADLAAGDGAVWLIIAGGSVTAWRAVAVGAVHGRFDPVPILQC